MMNGKRRGVQAPPANTFVVSFLGSQRGYGCLLLVLAEGARARGVAPAGAGVGGDPPPSLLGSWMRGSLDGRH